MKKKIKHIAAVLTVTALIAGGILPEAYGVFTIQAEGEENASDNAGTDQRLNAFYSQAIAGINEEDYENALFCLDACLIYCSEESNPELYADLYLKKGYCHLMRQELDEALEALDTALETDPELYNAILIKTSVYSQKEMFPEAIETLEKYIELTEDSTMYESLSQLYEQTGDMDKAAEAYRLFTEKNSGSETEALFAQGVYKLQHQMFEEAMADFTACLEDEALKNQAAYNAGLCQMGLGRYEEAIRYFGTCIEGNEPVDGMYYNRALCHMALGNNEEAIADFAASVENESYASDAAYTKATLEMGNNRYEDAIRDFTYCVEQNIQPGNSRINRGICSMLSGEKEKAMEEFSACIDEDINSDEARFYRSFMYLSDKQYEEALADINICIEHEYDLAGCYLHRAKIYKGLGDEEAYKADMEAAKNADAPDNSDRDDAADTGETAEENETSS